MQGDSETESEGEGLDVDSLPALTTVQSGSTSGVTPDPTIEGVLEAIRCIKQYNLGIAQWDVDLQGEIHAAANVVIHFVDRCNIISDPSGFLSTTLSIFAALVDISFLQILFQHRKTLKAAAIRSACFPHTGQPPGPILSWVDVFISKLSKLATTIAAGSFAKIHKQTQSECLNLQKDQNCFQAATQLPDHWQGISHVVASYDYSPAAQRLVLRLLFAAYVMGPQLRPFSPWVKDGISPKELLSNLYQGLDRVSCCATPPSAEFCGTEEKAEGAMFVSLFSVIYRRVYNTEPDSCPSPLWPKTLGRLLDLIKFTMTQDSLIPCGKLNEPQMILLRWGEVVPWTWLVWRDQRLTNSEQIHFLTSMWFFHMDTSHLGSIPSKSDGSKSVGTYLRFKLLDNTAASAAAVLQLLHQISLYLRNSRELQTRLSPMLLTVIRRTCWAVVQLLQQNWETVDSNVEGRLPQYCASMLLVLCFLQDSEEEIFTKQLISEALTLTSSHLLVSGVRHLAADKTFLGRLDGVILRSRGLITKIGSDHHPETALRAVSATLDLLTIIWKNKLEGLVISGSACLFMRAVLQTVVESSPDSLTASILRNSLLNSLAVCDYGFAEANWKEQLRSLWRHVISSKRCDFATASAFSRLVLTRTEVDRPLLWLDAWDYLRDALMLIVHQQCVPGDDSMALLSVSPICVALAQIIAKPSITQCILSSPWTTSLCAALRNVLESESSKLSTEAYDMTLKKGMERVGPLLLNQITSPQHPMPEGEAGQVLDMVLTDTRLIFHHLLPHSYVLVVSNLAPES